MKTSIDDPAFMLEIGDEVRITEGVTILCHDASVYTLDIAKKRGGGTSVRPVRLRRLSLVTMFSSGVTLY